MFDTWWVATPVEPSPPWDDPPPTWDDVCAWFDDQELAPIPDDVPEWLLDDDTEDTDAVDDYPDR